MHPLLHRLKGPSPTLLLGIGSLFLLIAAVMSAVAVWNSHRQAHAAAGAAMARSARLLEQGLTRSLDSLDIALQRVAEPLAEGASVRDAEAAISDALRFSPHLRQILILDHSGMVLADSTRLQSPIHGRRVPDLAAWGLGPEAPRSLGSPLRIGTAVAGRYLLSARSQSAVTDGHWVVPVELESASGGPRVIAALNPDFFLRAFAAVLTGPVEEAVLVRYGGTVLAGHTDGLDKTTGVAPWGWAVDAGLEAIIHDGVVGRVHQATPMQGVPGEVAVRLSEVYPVAVVLAFSDAGLLDAWLDDERTAVITLALAPVVLGALGALVLVLMRHRLRLRGEVRVLSRVVEEAPVAVIVTDRAGRIAFVNDSFTTMLGYQPSEVIGRTPAMLKSGHGREEDYAALWQTILSGGVWHGEFLNRSKDGRLVWMSAAVSGVRDDDGAVSRFVAVEADVTERKRSEATLAAMVTRLDTSNRELEQFARVASHDLQEPLRMVTGYLSLLQRRHEGLLPEEARGFIRNAISGADRMRGLIKDLLAYSQVSNRQVSLRAVDVGEAVDGALSQLRGKIVAASAVVERDPLPEVLAEERNLGNLFLNLIDNALTHRHPERTPHVHITYEDAGASSDPALEATGVGTGAMPAAGGYWAILIEDNGPGIATRDFDRIFRLFQHLQSRDDAFGNGVGLAVARRIAERAGGSITVESDGRTGSRFRVVLPKANAAYRNQPVPEALGAAVSPAAND